MGWKNFLTCGECTWLALMVDAGIWRGVESTSNGRPPGSELLVACATYIAGHLRLPLPQTIGFAIINTLCTFLAMQRRIFMSSAAYGFALPFFTRG